MQAGESPRRRRMVSALVVLVMLGAGLLLRLNGAVYGAPGAWFHSADEHDSAVRAILMARGDLLPVHGSKPTLYPGVIAAGYGAWYGVLKVAAGETAADFERRFYREPFGFCLVTRLVSVGASMGTLLILAGVFWRRGPGELATALAVPALGGCSVFYGHVGKEDALGAFLVLATFAATWRGLRADSTRVRWFGVAFACAGLAVATKYNCFFAVLFPALAAWGCGGLRVARTWAVFASACGAGFLAGVPFALLHPAEFLGRTFGSAIFTQVVGGWNILLYDDHRGLRFLARMAWREYNLAGLGMVAGLWALWGEGWRPWLWALLPAGLYGLVLLVSRQLDFQYLVPISPVLAWLAAEGMGRMPEFASRPWLRGEARRFCGVMGLLMLLPMQVLEGMAYRSDTRLVARDWLEARRLSGGLDPAKPVLVVSGAVGFYYPPLDFRGETFSRLAAEARRGGGAGNYFERAAANAAPGAHWNAHFLDVRTGFRRLPDGSREFAEQPFSTSLGDYRGKYSVVIVPGWTLKILEKRAPELSRLSGFLDELIAQGVLEEISPAPFSRGGPTMLILRAP